MADTLAKRNAKNRTRRWQPESLSTDELAEIAGFLRTGKAEGWAFS